VLELRDAEVELVPLLPRDETDVAEEVVQAAPGALADADAVAAPAAGDLVDQRAQLVDARADEPQKPLQRVLLAVRRLPVRQREVVLLRYFAEWSEADIAAALGISKGTVKSTAHKGLAALRVVLSKENEL